MSKTLTRALTGVTVFTLAMTGCAGGDSQPHSSPAASGPSGDLIVFAAASLQKPFNDLAMKFTEQYPNISVKYSFDGSSGLVGQMKGGAQADVFASADEKNMTKATDAGLVDSSKLFATNTLVLAVQKGNPGKITGLDSSLDDKKLVICAPEVPCGNATKKLAEQLGYTLKPVSEELKVTDVLGKVANKEADAGLVYKTDAASNDKVDAVEVKGAENVVNKYPVAVTKMSKHQDAAQAYVDYVLSAEGMKILEGYGFGKP